MGTVQNVNSAADEKTLRRVMDKSIAVGSGKGGVGKTITACNLAIYYARKGLHVGLVDLDPLSDVASLLDMQEAEQVLRVTPARDPAGEDLRSWLLPVFRGLEILFPAQKLSGSEVRSVMDKIYRQYLREIDGRFDVLLFDMPAGTGHDENLAYLPFMKRVVLVTNPEPTAHASAGAYAREVLRVCPGMRIQVWHNRFSHALRDGFHPTDVAGNYNRFVPASERLSPEEAALLEDFVRVPEDPALDLLQGEPHPAVHVLACMRDSLDYAHGELLARAARQLALPPRLRQFVTSYLRQNPRIGTVSECLERMGEYFRGVIQNVAGAQNGAAAMKNGGRTRSFSAEETRLLEAFVHRVKASVFRREILRLRALVSEQAQRKSDARRAFAAGLPAEDDSGLDREIARFLVALNQAARSSGLMRSQGVLLLFYFSLHKLLRSRTLLALLRDLIPRRTNQKGRKVRDRFRQIRTLVEQDPAYRARYLKTMRTLNHVAMKQLEMICSTFSLDRLLLRDAQGRVEGRAYLKLLASFLHETLYSGLSVIVGFEYRSAAAAFQDGAERLLASLAGTEHKP